MDIKAINYGYAPLTVQNRNSISFQANSETSIRNILRTSISANDLMKRKEVQALNLSDKQYKQLADIFRQIIDGVNDLKAKLDIQYDKSDELAATNRRLRDANKRHSYSRNRRLKRF